MIYNHNSLLLQPTALLQNRKVVNTVYLLVPPLGLLMMFMSPFYTKRERFTRALVTASFITFFAVMGADLRAYLELQVSTLNN